MTDMNLRQFIQLLKEQDLGKVNLTKPSDSEDMVIEFELEDIYNVIILIEDQCGH